MIRVVVADDQAVVRSGLRMILEANADISVVGEAVDGREAVAQCRELEPDVVLMDIRMPVLDGIAATEELIRQGSSTRVIVLTSYGVDENLYAALNAGAQGFFLKTDKPEQLIQAVRRVSSGDTQLGAEVVALLLDRFLAAPPTAASPPEVLRLLTAREREVLLNMGFGLSNAEIATRLFVSEGTAKTHVARILTKLQLRDRTQAVVFCYEHGLLRPGTRPPIA